jgi:hypothetical protein
MAKLPKSGIGYQCLDEREVTLADIVASLGLKPLNKKAEREIRDQLGLALATWDEPHTALQIGVVANSLRAHARRLDQIATLGTITRPGFARDHDLAIGGLLIKNLTLDPALGGGETARDYLRDFCDTASTIASYCRAAAASLQSTKGRGGKSRYSWHDEFTAVLLGICKLNMLEPIAYIDRISGEPKGTLFKVAREFERLLLPKMRSRKPATLVKRLQRSMQHLERQRTQVP